MSSIIKKFRISIASLSILSSVLFLCLFITSRAYSQHQNYLPGKVYVKVYPEYTSIFNSSTIGKNSIKAVLQAESITPLAKIDLLNKQSMSTYDLEISKIYTLTFDPNIPVLDKIEELKQTGYFEVVEPSYVFDILSTGFIPNDPLADPDLGIGVGMDQAIVHDFYSAWEIEKGDTNVVIGVVDTGIRYDRIDADNVKFNFNDPLDGINNDNDDYFGRPLVDNYRGWDVADWDNDPSFGTGSSHGGQMASIIAATPNDSLGMTGLAFNCKYIPYKASPDTLPESITSGYDAMLLAAMQGSDVINCSWGGFSELPQIFEDVTNWCTFTYDALVVSSSGNHGGEEVFYPGSFPNVISTASLSSDSIVADFSGHNYQVDLAAAGNRVLVAQADTFDEYRHTNGTSSSAAIVSGLAGLVRSRFPELSAIQVRRQLIVTADYIDDHPGNEKYAGKIGKMINPVAALTDTISPGLRPVNFTINNGQSSFNNGGETVSLDASITNLLRPGSNISYEITAISDNFSVISNEAGVINDLSTFDTIPNLPREALISLNPSSDTLEQYVGRIDFSDENAYRDHEYFFFEMTPAGITGVNDVENSDSPFSVFPNPFVNDLFVRDFNGDPNQIELFDSRSNKIDLIITSFDDLHRVSTISPLSPGVYFIKLNNGVNQQVLRRIKVN